MTAKLLQLAANLALPLDAVTGRLGVLGMSGAGKTYTGMKLAELMLDVGAQVIALDPVGPWWGLRAGADGTSPGFPIHVFGGIHGDLPLTPESGAMIAELLVDTGISAVLDVSDFTGGQMHRFVSDFAERFFELKKRKPTPVHVFLEEAQTFAPQSLPPDPGAAVMLGRIVRMIKVGRNYGIGTTQISQVPQAVAKSSLNQIACLIALRMQGAQERKAVGDWYGDKGDGADVEIKALLPKLPTGVAYVVSTDWLKVGRQVHIAPKTTFDSSATPKFGAKLAPPKLLAAVDVEALRQKMQAVVAQAEKDDPVALRREIARLQRELAAKPAVHTPPPVVVDRPILKDEQIAQLAHLVAATVESSANTAMAARDLEQVLRSAGRLFPEKKVPPPLAPARVSKTLELGPRGTKETLTIERGEAPLGKTCRAMLSVLASALNPTMTRQQLAMLSGLKLSGGTCQKYLSTLRSGGFIEDRGGALGITERGLAVVGGRPPPRAPEEIRAEWRSKLPGKARDMFDTLIVETAGISREDLAHVNELEITGGTCQKYLSVLRANGLVSETDGLLHLAQELR